MGPVARIYAQIKVLERQAAFLGRYGITSEQNEIRATIGRLEQDKQAEYKKRRELIEATKTDVLRPTFWHKQELENETKILKVA